MYLFLKGIWAFRMRVLHVMIQHLTQAIESFLETVIYLVFQVTEICVPCIMPVSF